MSNLEKYSQVFKKTFGIGESALLRLEYQGIPAWDSVGHMGLIAALEDAFGIQLDADDIVEFSSFEKGKKLLAKYRVVF